MSATALAFLKGFLDLDGEGVEPAAAFVEEGWLGEGLRSGWAEVLGRVLPEASLGEMAAARGETGSSSAEGPPRGDCVGFEY